MISQVLIILVLLVLYVLSIVALNFTSMRAGRSDPETVLPAEEDDCGDHS
jgi:Sec-independent protein secretion pathway component TatC